MHFPVVVLAFDCRLDVVIIVAVVVAVVTDVVVLVVVVAAVVSDVATMCYWQVNIIVLASYLHIAASVQKLCTHTNVSDMLLTVS
jgi:hypothetical protein